MGVSAKRVDLTEEEANTLKMLAVTGTTAQRIAVRAKVVFAAAQSLTLPEIAERTGLRKLCRGTPFVLQVKYA